MGQIRGPFPLPKTSPQSDGVPAVLALPSGGVYVPPAGNYLLNTGPNTFLQWWDPLAMTWRSRHAHQAALAIGTDGANYRLVNASGTVQALTIGAAGSGGRNGIGPVETGVTLNLAPPPAPAGTGTPVTAITVTAGGTGYSGGTTATVTSATGSGAQLTPVVAGGVVTAIQVTSGGQNYMAADTVTIADPGGGSGATATLTVAPAAASPGGQAEAYAIIGGQVPAPLVVQPGLRFEAPPVVCCDPPPPGGIQATFTATLDSSGGIAAVTQVDPGAGYVRVPQFYVIPQPRHYRGSVPWPPVEWFHGHDWERWRLVKWIAPGLIAPQNVWPGTLYQANIDAANGALIIGQPLAGDGTLTGAVVVSGGGGYTAAPAVTVAGGGLTGATATAQLATDASGAVLAPAADTSFLQAQVMP